MGEIARENIIRQDNVISPAPLSDQSGVSISNGITRCSQRRGIMPAHRHSGRRTATPTSKEEGRATEGLLRRGKVRESTSLATEMGQLKEMSVETSTDPRRHQMGQSPARGSRVLHHPALDWTWMLSGIPVQIQEKRIPKLSSLRRCDRGCGARVLPVPLS